MLTIEPSYSATLAYVARGGEMLFYRGQCSTVHSAAKADSNTRLMFLCLSMGVSTSC